MLTNSNWSEEELKNWVLERVGSHMWRTEGFDCSSIAEQCIEDIRQRYSEEIPLVNYLLLSLGQRSATLPPDCMGVIKVEFLTTASLFTTNAYEINQNLTGVTSIQMAGGKVGELADFLQWRKMFQRVTSQKPDWNYNEETNTLLVYNPAGYNPCVLFTKDRPFENIPIKHRSWVKEALHGQVLSRLAEYRGKYGGSLPGPGGAKLDLNVSSLESKAKELIDKSEETLKGIRPRVPIFYD